MSDDDPTDRFAKTIFTPIVTIVELVLALEDAELFFNANMETVYRNIL